MKILMVCLGNICRSPLAEGILKEKIEKYDLDWEVDSAGTGHWHAGEKPDPRSIAVGKNYGVDISRQRARQIKPKDLDYYDHILVMDDSNLRDVQQMASNDCQKKKIRRILELSESSNDIQNVPDPYYDDNGFEYVFRLLDNACDQLIRKL